MEINPIIYVANPTEGFYRLPNDIRYIELVRKLPVRDLLRLCCTNRRYALINRDPKTWSYLILRDFNIKYRGNHARDIYKFLYLIQALALKVKFKTNINLINSSLLDHLVIIDELDRLGVLSESTPPSFDTHYFERAFDEVPLLEVKISFQIKGADGTSISILRGSPTDYYISLDIPDASVWIKDPEITLPIITEIIKYISSPKEEFLRIVTQKAEELGLLVNVIIDVIFISQ